MVLCCVRVDLRSVYSLIIEYYCFASKDNLMSDLEGSKGYRFGDSLLFLQFPS